VIMSYASRVESSAQWFLVQQGWRDEFGAEGLWSHQRASQAR
jgi:hypothetical protein